MKTCHEDLSRRLVMKTCHEDLSRSLVAKTCMHDRFQLLRARFPWSNFVKGQFWSWVKVPQGIGKSCSTCVCPLKSSRNFWCAKSSKANTTLCGWALRAFSLSVEFSSGYGCSWLTAILAIFMSRVPPFLESQHHQKPKDRVSSQKDNLTQLPFSATYILGSKTTFSLQARKHNLT